MMRFGSICSGIEAATQAWGPMGWKCEFTAEIEKFPSNILTHHYKDSPNHGDITKFKEWPSHTIDILFGGTPCQSFSVAGLRKGLDDPRGNLMLTYLAIASKYQPKWLVWENVPGVLSSNGGKDFGTFLGGLGQLGYGFSYRVLDAQYFGVAQRRRRVFVVGCLGDWRRAAAVLFERESLCGNPAPSRKKGKEIAPTIRAGAPNGSRGKGARSGDSKDELIVGTLCSDSHPGHYRGQDAYTGRLIPHCMATGQAGAEIGIGIGTTLNCNHEAPIIAIHGTQDPCVNEDVAFALGRNSGQENAIAIQNATRGKSQNGLGVSEPGQPMFTLDQCSQHAIAFERRMVRTTGGQPSVELNGCLRADENSGDGAPCVASKMKVRRLTPRECERLQGFPDDYTLIPVGKKMSADRPRYKAIGNSMAVPCMAWIGKRIQEVHSL